MIYRPPDDATFLIKSTLGHGNVSIDIDTYSVVVGPNTVYLSMASADCTPVYQAAYGSAGGGDVLINATLLCFRYARNCLVAKYMVLKLGLRC